MDSKAGFTLSNRASGAPIMIAIVPCSAPDTPPDTGASIRSIPCSARRAAISFVASGSPVVMSAISAPFGSDAATPSGPNRTCSTCTEVGRQVRTSSAPDAPTPSGPFAAIAPSATRASIAAWFISQTCSV